MPHRKKKERPFPPILDSKIRLPRKSGYKRVAELLKAELDK
ncbi:hypothetical protein LCGC14_1364010 [marine sediment metagenome]|uniref:Uncharacterized protein n=1 Tax=marine sediment metagenome TaxID=412755 RepID=A0A0F9N9D5_9ZZZZ